jgi:hypothetical protein
MVMFGISCLLLLSETLTAQESVSSELLRVFKEKDYPFSPVARYSLQEPIRGFDVSFTMKRADFLDRTQGAEITTYTVLWTADW